jgi:phage anti-repressor protein
MNELKLIESGLIKVYETEKGEKVVNGRELHEGLENKRQYADWVKQRLIEVDAVENEDYISISQNCEKPSGGRPTIDYILKLNIAKEMAMLEKNSKGKEYRRYLITIEEKYKTNPLLNLSKELQAIFITDKKVQLLETHVAELDEKVDNQITVTYNQATEIQRTVASRVIELLGGKDTKDYKNFKGSYFQQLHRDLKDRLGVPSYRDIRKIDYQSALTYIKAWLPKITTKSA